MKAFQIIISIILIIAGLLFGFGYYYDNSFMKTGSYLLLALGFIGNVIIAKKKQNRE